VIPTPNSAPNNVEALLRVIEVRDAEVVPLKLMIDKLKPQLLRRLRAYARRAWWGLHVSLGRAAGMPSRRSSASRRCTRSKPTSVAGRPTSDDDNARRGRIEIDNNCAERPLRGVSLVRKNYLLMGSDAGGERAATIYSPVETAKLNGLDLEAYLREVLGRVAEHPINRIDELLPWNIGRNDEQRLAA